MIDSYRGPVDLAAARRRVDGVVAERCREAGLNGSISDSAVVRLSGKSFAPNEDLITAETVCVVADLVLWRWDRASLEALADALAPDRTLVFLEPTADLGWRRAVHRGFRRLAKAALRHDFEADVPAMLREVGLVVTTTDRFSFGPLQIRSYVWGEAKHFTIPYQR